MARPRPSLPVLVLAAVAFLAAVLIAVAVIKEHGTPSGSSSDAKLNQKIIDQLQPYPGTHQRRTFVRESYGGYGGGLLPGQSDTSHTTTTVYSLPAKTKPKQVAQFYRRQLPGWQDQGEPFFCETQGPGGPCFLAVTKGDAIVTLGFDRQRKTYSLTVNARGAASSGSSGD